MNTYQYLLAEDLIQQYSVQENPAPEPYTLTLKYYRAAHHLDDVKLFVKLDDFNGITDLLTEIYIFHYEDIIYHLVLYMPEKEIIEVSKERIGEIYDVRISLYWNESIIEKRWYNIPTSQGD